MKSYDKLMREAKTRRARIVAMRNSGKTNAEIGRKFGVTAQRVSQIVHGERAKVETGDMK